MYVCMDGWMDSPPMEWSHYSHCPPAEEAQFPCAPGPARPKRAANQHRLPAHEVTTASTPPVTVPLPAAAAAAAAASRGAPLCFSSLQAAMLRGTRPHGDVYTSASDDALCELIYPFPYPSPSEFSYPRTFDCGAGLVKALHRILLVEYKNVFKNGNAFHYHSKSAEFYSSRYLTGQASYHLRNAEDAKGGMDVARKRAATILNQMHALGIEPYVPSVVGDIVESPKLLPFGSMSYLAKPPYCFLPEEFSVPAGLPVEDVVDYLHPKTVGEANLILRKRFGFVAREVNNVRFFRDWRIRIGVDCLHEIYYNPLTSRLGTIYTQLDSIVQIMNKFKSKSNELFKMPEDLKELALSDPVVMTMLTKEHLSGLSHQPAEVKVLYVLYVCPLGLGLFHAKGLESSQQDINAARNAAADVTSFKLSVKLCAFYPFPSVEAGKTQYDIISQGVCTRDLRLFIHYFLPRPADRDYVLGVKHRKVVSCIAEETGITCVKNKFFKEVFKGIKIYFKSFFEGSELVEKASN